MVLSFAAMPVAAVAPPSAALEFRRCTDEGIDPALAGSLCARTLVAIDPSNTTTLVDDGASIELFIRQFPPKNGIPPRGRVWLIAGGPGESGASFYGIIQTMRRAFPGYALLVPDHRGTGFSSRLCPPDESESSPGGLALAGVEWESCPRSMFAAPVRTMAFTVTNAAHDLSQLIARSPGDGPTHIYAVSYGTQLVLRMMSVAPVQVDSLLLDGLIPPEGSTAGDLGRRTAVVDAVGRSLLDARQQAAYRAVLSGSETVWRVAAPEGDLREIMASFLTFPETRAAIPGIVDGLSQGDTGLLFRTIAVRDGLASGLGRFAQSPLSLPLVMLVSGSEHNERRDISVAVIEQEKADALFVSPLPALLPRIAAPLYPRDRFYGMVPAALPPTLVMQGTLDPNTPYGAATQHIDRLGHSGSVTLASVEGGSHFLALTAPDCFVAVGTAFIDGDRVEDCAVP